MGNPRRPSTKSRVGAGKSPISAPINALSKATEAKEQKQELDRLRQAGHIIGDEAKRIAAGFSTRIPETVQVGGGSRGLFITAGGEKAPNAAYFDPDAVPGQRQKVSRHPLFGDRKHWYRQPYRPFMQEAADRKLNEAAAQFAKVIDDWAKTLGFH